MPHDFVLPSVVNLPAEEVRRAACNYISSIGTFNLGPEEIEQERYWAEKFVQNLPTSGYIHLYPEVADRLGI